MKRIPRYLATLLIFALLNISYIHLALASSTPSPKVTKASPVSTPAPVSNSVPDDPDPCSPLTKKCIENDLNQTQTDFDNLKGTDPNSFSYKFFTDSGFDITDDVSDAKTDLNNMSDDDFNKNANSFGKGHKKFKKRHEQMAAILGNPSLMALLHRPAPLKFHVVVTSASGVVAPGNEKALFVSSTTQDMNRSFPSMKSTARRGEFAKGLAGLNIVVVPELDGTCTTGDGVPTGINGVFIAKTVEFLAEAVKEAIPDDTATVIPHGIAVVAWAAAKGAALLLDGIHAVYMECKTIKDGDKVDSDLQSIKGSVSTTNTSLTTIDSNVTNIKGNVTDIKTTVNGINSHTDTKIDDVKTNDNNNKNSIITEIDTKASSTSTAISTSTSTITNNIDVVNNNIDNSRKLVIDNDNTNTTNINTKIDNSKTTIINNDNTNATNIVNNANSNTTVLTTLSLRLMIEADLQQSDNAVPLALFETPASKGGYLELVRSIVAETYQHLTTLSAAQINAALASGDSYKAAGNYKAAYAAYKKAYKTAAN